MKVLTQITTIVNSGYKRA